MKEYLAGYYCRDALHLQIINKESNRKILQALKDSYPLGLDAKELAKKTKLPLKTIYAQKSELYREYYISDYDDEPRSTKRGRPKQIEQDNALGERHKDKYVIEETSGVYDVYEEKKPIPLPPGNVRYADGFVDIWDKLVGKEEKEELCIVLLHFLEKIFARVNDHNDNKVRKWAPERNIQHCCSHCGLNHEARDFIRALLLRLIDHLEKNDDLINYLKDNDLLTQKGFELIAGRKT
jgi:hypothetical protein